MELVLYGIAMVFIIEGLFYAIFPSHIKRIMAMAITMPTEKLRSFGALMLVSGALLVWLIKNT